jgi:hypothetical protein
MKTAVVAFILGAFSVGAFAVAQSGGSSNDVIKGCIDKKSGQLRVLAKAKTGKPAPKCGRTESALSWNKQGPAGAPGAGGTTGPRGAQGDRGPAGADGAQGVSGPTGPSGTPGVGGTNGARGPTGPMGPAGPGTTEANAFDFSTGSNTRLLASVQGFDFIAVCTSSGVQFHVTNNSPGTASVYQQTAGAAPTVVTAASGGDTTPTASQNPGHVTYMAPQATNAFVVELWGRSTGTGACHAAGVRTSEVAN